MNFDIDFQALDIVSLIIIFFCLVIILLANHLLKQKTKKTLDHIEFMLEREMDDEKERLRSKV